MADYSPIIQKAAETYGLDPVLIQAQMHQESGGKSGAISNKGASGLMQLMPATAREMGVTDIFDPEQNIMAGAKYLKTQLDKYKSPELALAAYNAGPGAVDKYGRVPPYKETRNYVKRIMGNYKKLGGSMLDYVISPANADETPYQEVPDITPDELAAYRASQQEVPDITPDELADYRASQKPEKTLGQKVGGVVTDVGGGVLKGASNIGNTLISGAELLGGHIPEDAARRNQATEGIKSMGVDTSSLPYKGAELGTELAGTAGVGSALAGGAKAIPALAKYAPALDSWGMQGKALERIAGGAATGAASSGLIDPRTAGTGAVIGGALPPAIQVSGKFGQAVGNAFRSLTKPVQEKVATKIAEATGKSVDDVIVLLTNKARSKELPDLLRTVPQILQDPNISQLARTVKANSSMSLGEAEAAQQQIYKNALEGIAPSGATVQDAADKAGSAISKSVQGDYKTATKQVSKAFNQLRNNPEKNIELPIDRLKSTVDQYLGKGTVGKGSGAKSALNEAQNISKLPKPEKATFSQLMGMTPKAEKETINKVGFKELQNLRSSIGDLSQQAKLSGKNTESAALKQMVTDIDSHLDDLANSADGMTSDTLKAYKEARAMHKAKMDRFKTGAQSGLFKPKSNGEMAVEGGEIPGKFYSSRASQSRDVGSFKRLVGNKPELVNELKQYALTKAGQTATATGNLANGYVKWAKSHSGANNELFTAAEKAKIDAVASEISRAARAENLGRVTGSDTAQKLKSITDLGLVDNKAFALLASKIPAGNALLSALKESSGRERSNMIAELLADPGKLKSALKESSGRERPNMIAELLADPGKLKSALASPRSYRPSKALANIGKATARSTPALSQIGRD